MKASNKFSSIQELYECTIDNLKDDMATLSSCSLACRAWSHRSRQLLFCSVRLDNIEDVSRIAAFIDTLLHSPPADMLPVGQLIRELALVGFSSSIVELGPPVPPTEPQQILPSTYRSTTVPISTLWKLINQISFLSSLSLINLSISFHSLVPPWKSIPVDQRPSLHSFLWKQVYCSNSHSCVELLNMFSSVEELSNQNSLSSPLDGLLSTLASPDILAQQLELPAHIFLKKLSVSSLLAETTILFAVLPMTRCLQSLRIVDIQFVIDNSVTSFSHFFSTIGPNLTHLTLNLLCLDSTDYLIGHLNLRACVHLLSIRLHVTMYCLTTAIPYGIVQQLDTIASSSLADITLLFELPTFPIQVSESTPGDDAVWEQFHSTLRRFTNLKTLRFEVNNRNESHWLAFVEVMKKHLSHLVDAGNLSL
ncbi:hypothetical protein C8Q75DRAFT_765566 [Abortiporus biennis]|nr:hypothetical protein C8Q75DRAFT_765566 [Abortiporus biennis]